MSKETRITLTEHCYVVREAGILSGEPIVKDTRTPVRSIVELWRMGYTPEEIPSALPNLDLATWPRYSTRSATTSTIRQRILTSPAISRC